jgi:flagellar hook assembly protein FlgD
VRVAVYDVAGRMIRALASRTLEAGAHSFTWDARDERQRRVEPGTYLVRASIEGKELVQKLTIVN